jgi:DNA-binding MarR family transcriptional regulator
MLEHDDPEAGRRFRDEALTVSTSIWTWTQSAGLGIAEGPVLLALSETDGGGATAVSARSGLPLDTVYPALHRLTDRGYVVEQHRRHRLTVDGQRLVADFDRYCADGSNSQTKGMS